MMKLTDAELSTVTHALRIAAEEYDKHAREWSAKGPSGHGAPWGPAGLRRMVDQFKRQAREARELAVKLDDAAESVSA